MGIESGPDFTSIPVSTISILRDNETAALQCVKLHHAEAICEAVTRANMRFVETKTPEQQSCLMLHRTRHLFIRQQTAVINAIRAHLAEFEIVAPVGRNYVPFLTSIKRGKAGRDNVGPAR